LDNGGGPSYLFATVATQFLRTAGYRTRLAQGYVVQSEDYDRKERQSIVGPSNAHFWPEVSLDGTHWIPLEPDPTFDVPYSTQTWWQWMKGKFGEGMALVKRNPLTSTGMLLALAGFGWFRREIHVGILRLGWLACVGLMPARRLKFTRKLIDARFRVAGIPRPSFSSIRNWFSQVDGDAGADFFKLWWRDNFGRARDMPTTGEEVLLACQQIESELSFDRIKSFVRETKGRKHT